MFSVIFPVVFPVFTIAALGYWWARTDKPFDTQVVTALVTNIGTPALIVDTLLTVSLPGNTLMEIMTATVVIHGVLGVGGWLMLAATRQPVRSYLPAIIFGNTGNMGLPLCLFAFGEEGLALAVGFFVPTAVLQFTLGHQLAAGRASARQLLRTPMIWAVAIALPLAATGTTLPTALTNTIGLLGGLTIPLMLMALGVSLSRLQVTALGRATVFSVIRLGVGAAAGWIVATLMGLDGIAFGVVVVESAMPVAVFNYLFAQRYANRPEDIAGTVVISTALSFLTLPLILAFVMT